jgi:uncharacterized protein YabE (DUF348 family)
MHKRIRRKKIRKVLYVVSILTLIVLLILFFVPNRHIFEVSDRIEQIVINDDGKNMLIINADFGSVEDVLRESGVELGDGDRVFPNKGSKIFSGDTINIERKKALKVTVDGQERELETYGEKVGALLARNDITFDDNDIIVPTVNTVVRTDVDAEIVRVEYKEEEIIKDIPFKQIVKEDDDVNFLKRYVEQEGEKGEKKIIYKVAYHNGEEVDREVDREEITKEPFDEVVIQGTQVKLGKKHTGACSWYSHTGTLSAANQWLPKGSYVKVTNKANGKSVIVQINDRGPFVAGRIIDLDKVAFQKIASLGAGVIDVKMEEVVQ